MCMVLYASAVPSAGPKTPLFHDFHHEGSQALSDTNKPKKKDLSDLRARLAKKSAPEPAAAPAMPAGAPPPAPGQAAGAPPPAPAAPPASAPAQAPAGDNPFGGGPGVFMPDEDFDASSIDMSGPSQTKFIIMVGAVAATLGVALGWVLHTKIDGEERLAAAQSKGATMYQAVKEVAEVRAKVSLRMDDLKKQFTSEPDAAITSLTGLLEKEFAEQPRVDALFGWQLAGLHPDAIKIVFDLYRAANALDNDLRQTTDFISKNKAALANASKMGQLGVIASGGGAQLVFISSTICDMEAGTACDKKSKPGDAQGYSIKTSAAGESTNVGLDAVQPLIPNDVFSLAFGEKPENNAVLRAAQMLAQVEGDLATMNKKEKIAIAALEQYEASPTIDADSAQPAPAGE